MSRRKLTKEEEDFLRSLTEVRMLEGLSRELGSRIAIVDAVLGELQTCLATIEGSKGQKAGCPAFAPIGGGSYLKVALEEPDKVIVGIGAGVALEKPVEEAIDYIRNRIAEVQQARASLGRQLTEVSAKLQEARASLDRATRELSKRGLLRTVG